MIAEARREAIEVLRRLHYPSQQYHVPDSGRVECAKRAYRDEGKDLWDTYAYGWYTPLIELFSGYDVTEIGRSGQEPRSYCKWDLLSLKHVEYVYLSGLFNLLDILPVLQIFVVMPNGEKWVCGVVLARGIAAK